MFGYDGSAERSFGRCDPNEKVKILQNTKLDYTEQISEAVYGAICAGVNEVDEVIKGYLEEDR